jgi:hypothetical protein
MKIIYDVFPAKLVALPAGIIDDIMLLSLNPPSEGSFFVDRARVIATEKKLLVAVDTPEGAKIVFQETYTTFIKDDISRFVTEGGKMFAVQRDTNCGCGSRLRAWNPFKTLYSIKDV